MREIKFRGKLINKYAEEWFYGDLIQVKDGTVNKKGNLVIDYYIITDDYSSKYNKIELRTCQSPKVNADTIGQYTGLKDKNGVEIYEGDILRFSDEDTAIVKFNEKYSYFMLEPIQDYYFDSDVLGHGLEYNDVEVIGNIWDNPELLKESD